MPTPREGYYLRDGTRVPGTTTVIGRFKESGGLIHWSWNIAHGGLLRARALLQQVAEGDGLFSQDDITAFLALPLSEWDYRAKREKAADAGTCAHDMVECWIRQRPFDASRYPAPIVRAAEPAFGAFLAWARQSNLRAIESETALVSEQYRYGGTLDAMLIGGALALGDWKTSNAIYPDYLCQLAAYGQLWTEHYPERPIVGGYHLLRFSKQDRADDPVNFTHHYWSHLNAAWEAFRLMRELYTLMDRLKKLAA